AVYAERTDIAEEIKRLNAHLDQFGGLIGARDGKPIGRTLDFLAQEMLREANTIASKSPDAAISRCTVEIKGAIDRIKEQAQNIEKTVFGAVGAGRGGREAVGAGEAFALVRQPDRP